MWWMRRTQVYLISLKSAYLGAKCRHSTVALFLLLRFVKIGRQGDSGRGRTVSRRSRTLSRRPSCSQLRLEHRDARAARLALDTVVVHAVHPAPFSSSYFGFLPHLLLLLGFLSHALFLLSPLPLPLPLPSSCLEQQEE